jgi:hypothetical protein
LSVGNIESTAHCGSGGGGSRRLCCEAIANLFNRRNERAMSLSKLRMLCQAVRAPLVGRWNFAVADPVLRAPVQDVEVEVVS